MEASGAVILMEGEMRSLVERLLCAADPLVSVLPSDRPLGLSAGRAA